MSVKIQPLEPSTELPTKFEYLEYLNEYYGWSNYYTWDFLYDFFYDYLTDYLVESFHSKELSRSIFEEFFNGDWRKGQEICKIVITQRFYQISPNSTQA